MQCQDMRTDSVTEKVHNVFHKRLEEITEII